MAFINNSEVIFWKIVKQAEWSCPRFPAVEEAGIVFNTVTVTKFPYHFKIIVHPFTDALRFNIFSAFFEVFYLGRTFILYFTDHLCHHVFRRQVEVCRKYGGVFNCADSFATAQLKRFNAFDLIAKETDAVTKINIRQVDINSISFYPESSPGKISLAALIQGIHKRMQEALS